MAVIENRVGSLEREHDRTRERLHDLESDRATLRILVQQVADLAKNANRVANAAAERAVDQLLERRARSRHREIGAAASLLSAGAGIGALLITLLR